MITPSSRAHSYVHKHFEVAQWVHHLISNSHIIHRMSCHHSTTWTTITTSFMLVWFYHLFTSLTQHSHQKKTQKQNSCAISSSVQFSKLCSFNKFIPHTKTHYSHQFKSLEQLAPRLRIAFATPQLRKPSTKW